VPASALVTGGRGFVGAWICRQLVERGDRVTVLDRVADADRRSALDLLGVAGDVATVEGDLVDGHVVRRTIAEHDIDTVFHLAAQTLVGPAAESPAATFETNVRGTWIVLEASRESGVGRVVVASSDKAYGAHEELPYREDFALRPTAPYEASKAAADLLARSYWPSYGLPVAVTRFANIYGGGDTNFSRLIPEAVSAALDGRPPVLRSDGSPQRDFLYVEDAADAYLTIADGLDRDQVRGQAFNAGGGSPHAVGEVVEMIARLAGTDVKPEILGAGNPAGEIDRQYVDPGKIREVLGWEPRVELEEGLGRTIEWYRAHPQAHAPAATSTGSAGPN
jgi:CDP-glucose 4,6-dehydratase